MNKTEIADLITESDSVYALVVAVAKRSRDLAQQAQETGEELEEKPVSMAIDEFAQHKLRVVYEHR